MSGRGQYFQGNVNDVAGRDVVKNSFHIPESKPESELQATFWRNTRIHCSKLAREEFESLMDDGDFTAAELRRAWDSQALVWDSKNERLKCTSGYFELVMGWFFVGCIGLTYTTLLFATLGSHYGHLIQAALVALSTSCAVPAFTHTVQRIIFSHYTAHRAVRYFERKLQ